MTWIAKPVGSAQGKGIFLFNDLKDVRAVMRNLRPAPPRAVP